MNAYRINIPKKCLWDQQAGGLSLNRVVTLTRQEISEKIVEHAFNLGWVYWGGDLSREIAKENDSPYIILDSDGTIWKADTLDRLTVFHYKDISWSDFLLLSKEGL